MHVVTSLQGQSCIMGVHIYKGKHFLFGVFNVIHTPIIPIFVLQYFNLKDISALEEKFTFKFAINIKLPTNQQIKKNKKVKLPLYLAKFALDNEHCVLVQDILKKDEKKEIEMAPSLFNLKKYDYFYATSKKLNFNADLLYYIYTERMRCFLQFLFDDDFEEEKTEFMSYCERKVLEKGRKALNQNLYSIK